LDSHLDIRPATPAEAPVSAAILMEVVRWLEAKGEPLWTPEQVTAERLAKHAEAGELHIARRDGLAVGTFLLQWEDRFAWPDVPAGESAFVHKLAVIREAAGSGVATAMLDWATRRAAERGRKYLRLDCAPRPKLCAFYERVGFRQHSEVQVGRYTLVRYEMQLQGTGSLMSDAKQLLWGQEYTQRRAQGHTGWTAATEYERKQARLVAAFERYGMRAGDRFLELGSGAGNITLWASGLGLRATGIDFVRSLGPGSGLRRIIVRCVYPLGRAVRCLPTSHPMVRDHGRSDGGLPRIDLGRRTF
jgi:GNAT superfamily N-acetyltransferase